MVKKVIPVVEEIVQEEIVQEEVVQEEVIESDTDSVVERVVSKVQKIITIKKVLTPKQQAHLDKLALVRKGKKTSYKEIPTKETKPVKSRAKKVKVEVEESEESEEIITPIKKFNKSLF
jgi:imidazolonepropionase-like amidohydrolase